MELHHVSNLVFLRIALKAQFILLQNIFKCKIFFDANIFGKPENTVKIFFIVCFVVKKKKKKRIYILNPQNASTDHHRRPKNPQ